MLGQQAREAAHARVNGPAVAADWRQRLRRTKLGELRAVAVQLRSSHEHQLQRQSTIIQVNCFTGRLVTLCAGACKGKSRDTVSTATAQSSGTRWCQDSGFQMVRWSQTTCTHTDTNLSTASCQYCIADYESGNAEPVIEHLLGTDVSWKRRMSTC